MIHERSRLVVLFSLLPLLGAGCVRSVPVSSPPVPDAAPTAPGEHPSALPVLQQTKVVNLGSFPGVHRAFAVRLVIPDSWRVEVVPEIEAINLYDPAAPGATPREQSQIFLRHFRANEFLTLNTVTIASRTPGVVAGRPAVMYLIEKRAGVAPFPHQPEWRNRAHRVTDVRLSDQNPSEFLVFGQRPGLPDAVFDAVLESLQLASSGSASLVSPTRDFVSAVTKKPFGIFITPATSPVQPDRFQGYHTGADAELPAGTSVHAIADGTVVRSGRVAGYGGLVAVAHPIEGEVLVGIYGHLDPGPLPRVGARLRAGESIGALGTAFTAETDGARAHLHFGLYRGPGVDVRGYVQDAGELARWKDPLAFLWARSAPATGGG